MKVSVYIKVAVMLVLIAAVSLGLTALVAVPPPVAVPADDLHVVTSFYPVYIAAVNVVGDTEGVTVTNLVDSQVGCLHDFQMKTTELARLSAADIVVMNGAGAEPFLDDAAISCPIIDLSVGQELLKGGHVHEHAHAHEEVDASAANGHLWVSPLRYRRQVETLCDRLCTLDSDNAAAYTQNAADYLEKIDAVWSRLQTAAAPFAQDDSLLFHDSLLYLAEDLDLNVIASVNIGEQSTADPATLAQASGALDGSSHALFWYDSQYTTVEYAFLQAIPESATVLVVNTGVSGDGGADSWLSAMTALCEDLEAAV